MPVKGSNGKTYNPSGKVSRDSRNRGVWVNGKLWQGAKIVSQKKKTSYRRYRN